nr:putative RNA-directed DNA polymerase [Tanacetum cinerariifolium]
MTIEGSSFGQPNILKFDGDHDHWSLLMKNLLRSKEYWIVVENEIPEEGENQTPGQRKNLEDMKLKDLKAKNYLFSLIDKSILKTITKKETSKELWDSMKMRYQGSARVKRAQLKRLRREFEILAMKTGESVTSYFGRVVVVANEMENYREAMEDVKIVEKILRTLTDKQNFVVCSIEESKDVDEMTVDDLQSSLLVHEQKFRRIHDGEVIQALKVTFDDSRGGRGRGRFSPRGRGRGRGRAMQSRDMIECYKCHKLGHYQFECSDWNKEPNYAVVDDNKEEEEVEMLLMAYTTEVLKRGDGWDDIFQEDKGCDWSKTHSEDRLVDLAWEDEVNNNSSKEGDGVVMATEEEDVVATNDEDASVRNNTHHGRVNEADTRSRWSVHAPVWMNDYVLDDELEDIELNLSMAENSDPVSDPISCNKAVKRKHWRTAIMDEIKSIEKNNTWSLVEFPKGAKTVGVKWIYKTKLNENGELQKYKARLVAKGYSQRYGVDYLEVYAPVARMETVRTIIALAAQQRWNIYQLDVKSAFLHGKLDEDVYVEQPRGFEVKGSEKKVYKLHKELYGLKQAPRAWFNMIDSYSVAQRLEKCLNEQTLFTKRNEAGNLLIVSIYVDDLIYTGDNEAMLKNFKASMMKYATEVLKCFGMWECKAVKTPIARGMELNKDESGVAVSESYYKQIVACLMYLTATSLEAEFIAAVGCSTQAIWLKRVLEKIGCASKDGVTIYCDNSLTIKLSKNPLMHGRSKHIDVLFHFLRELVQSKIINLRYCDTKEQIANIMTKPLLTEAFEKLRSLLGVSKLEV